MDSIATLERVYVVMYILVVTGVVADSECCFLPKIFYNSFKVNSCFHNVVVTFSNSPRCIMHVFVFHSVRYCFKYFRYLQYVLLDSRGCVCSPGLVSEAGVAFQEAVRRAPEPQLAVNPTPGAEEVGVQTYS